MVRVGNLRARLFNCSCNEITNRLQASPPHPTPPTVRRGLTGQLTLTLKHILSSLAFCSGRRPGIESSDMRCNFHFFSRFFQRFSISSRTLRSFRETRERALIRNVNVRRILRITDAEIKMFGNLLTLRLSKFALNFVSRFFQRRVQCRVL